MLTDPAGVNFNAGPCGAVAGVWASTDSSRGVWKAPAGTAATITGIANFTAQVDDGESGTLNPLAVNTLRTMPAVGPVVWGARTTVGVDQAPNQWKYLPIRRLALYIEESLRRGTQWSVFEPNDEPLWSSLRLNVTTFMQGLFRQGAFQGSTPADAYVVQFRVKVDGAYVAGISKVSALKRTTEVIKFRDGGDASTSHKSPARTEYEAVTLERGVTHDLAFQQWANKVWDYQNAQAQNADQEVSLADFRKDVIIDLFNEAGQKVISYQMYRCWVSEYQALPELDANAAAVAIQHIKLENEGWDRDPAVVEPTEPSFTG